MKKGNFRRRKFNRKRKSTYKVFFLVVVAMTLGFAAVNTTLQLIGTLNISRTTWNIHWENPTKVGGVNATQDVHLKQNDNTTVEYQVNLANPGDYYEFTVDAKNEGTIDAMITGFDNKVYENNVEITKPDYLDFIVTYSDDSGIANNHLLASTKSETYKVKVMYKDNLAADELPTTTRNLKFTFSVTYMQADDNAIPVNVDFETSSWDELASAYTHNRLTDLQTAMTNGTTREVKMDLDNNGTDETYYVRIANLSKCTSNETSHTACGFVIEFANIIAMNRMNELTDGTENGNGNKGGWEYSEMRAYLNNKVYAYQNVDYSTTGIYNHLPSDLKNAIIPTTVISGYGSNDSTNFNTTDNLYLFSKQEVDFDTSYDTTIGTKVLDYYDGISNNNRVKKYNNTAQNWWLRSAGSNLSSTFWDVSNTGDTTGHLRYANSNFGVSPAFRIAE